MRTWKHSHNNKYICYLPRTRKYIQYQINNKNIEVLSMRYNVDINEIEKVLSLGEVWEEYIHNSETNSILNWDLFHKLNDGHPIDLEIKDDFSSYCPECEGCGEEGCCSPLKCKFSGDCSYMQTNLNHLSFAYKMYNWIEEELYEVLPEDMKEKFDKVWDTTYDEIYNK